MARNLRERARRTPTGRDLAEAARRWQPRVGEFTTARLLWN